MQGTILEGAKGYLYRSQQAAVQKIAKQQGRGLQQSGAASTAGERSFQMTWRKQHEHALIHMESSMYVHAAAATPSQLL